MSACDYCVEGIIRFCQMCETPEGRTLHWEYVQLWHLEGLFPCDYDYPDLDSLIFASLKWVQDIRQPHGIRPAWMANCGESFAGR